MSIRNEVETTSTPLRLLILEDNPRDAKLMTSLLKREGLAFEYEVTDSAEDFQEKLRSAEFDVIITDFNLRGWTALHALEFVNRSGKDVPVIVITGTIGDEAAVDLIKRGASDYILKDRQARLPVAIRQALLEKRLRQERQKTEAQMRLQSAALESAANGIAITDRNGTILSVNPAFTFLTGYSLEEVVGKNPRAFKSGHHDAGFYREMWETILAGKVWHGELVNCRKDGSPYHEEMTITPVLDSQGAITNFVAVKQDVTERKRAENELRRLNRALRTISSCNEILVRAQREQELLESICQCLVALGGYRMAWVGYAGQDPAKAVRPVAHAGFEEGYLSLDRISWADDEHGQGPTALAIRTGQQVVNRNTPLSDGMERWRHEALKRGYVSSIALPLNAEAQTIGALTVYATEPDAFDDAEVKLLTELAGDLGFGIDALRSRVERRRAEERLRDSEARFRFLFASNPLPMWVYDLETWQFIEVNDAAVAHYGYSREEFLRLSITDIHAAGEVRRLDKNLAQERQVLEEPGPWRHQLKDGRIILAQTTSHLLTWNGRKSALVVAQDITERARGELALRESEERYRALFEHNLAGVFRTNTDGDILECNVAMANMLGASSPREILAHNVMDFYFSERDRAQFIGDLEARGKVTDYELRLLRKDGSSLWVIGNVGIRAPAAGGAPVIEGTLVDITERKSAEEALRQERHLLGTLVDNIPDAIYFKDRGNRFTRINAAQAKRFGLSDPSQAEGKTDFEFFGAEHAQMTYDDEQGIVATGKPIVGLEEKETWPDGRVSWVSTTKMPLRDAQGDITGTFGVSRDITESKRAEEALRRSEAYLAAGEQLTHTGSWAWNIATGELFWSRETYRIFGFDPAVDKASVGGTFLTRIHPEDRARIEAQLEGSQPGEVDYRIVLASGSVRYVHEIVYPVIDASGKVAERFGVVSDVTERKQSEREVSRLAAIVSSSDDAIYSADADGAIITWNAGAVRLYGYTAEEIKGKYFTTLIPEEGRSEAAAVRERLFRGEGLIHYEFEHRRKDGERLQLSLTLSPIKNAAGAVTGVSAIAHDITDRKRSEAALRESEERFRRIAETITEVFWVADPHITRMLYISPGYEQVWGRSVASLYENPRSFIDAIHSEDREQALAVLATQKDGRPFEQEYRIIRPDGSIRWIWDRGFPVRDAVGQVTSYVGVAQDITERKRAEEENSRLATAIEQSAEAVMMTDPQGAIEYVNPAFTRITGYAREEVQGKNPRILNSGKQDEDFYRQLWSTILQGNTWHGELVNRRKDGSFYDERTTIAPVRNARGEITHFIDIKEDVTERKALELQLQKAAKMEAVGRLAGGVAHDFNNLLTVMNGYSELLLEMLDPDGTASSFVKEIRGAGDRAASLTRQLLAFSRQQVLTPQVLNLNTVIANVEKMLRRLIGEDVKLRTALEPALAQVKADPGQIEQVIMNLAVNARDAMPQGGNLTLETSNVELDEGYAHNHVTVKSGPHVMLAVGDTGTGMSPEVKARIFEPFFTTKEMGKGTGLGLATVYGIVKQSGGSIWVYSELGQGTVFKVYFPAVSEAPETAKASIPVKSTSGTETILVVEDEESVRSLIRLALTSGGYKVVEADDAEKALALCASYEGPIHLLLTDVVMPKMSGPLVAEKVAAVRPGVKVIFMSGYTDDAIVHHGMLSAGMPFIQKPFSPILLRRKIREVLGET